MLGTIVNSLAIIFGSILGLFLRGGLKENYKSIVMNALALSVIFIGSSSAIGGINSGNANPVLFIVSLVLGSLIGEFLKIEEKLQSLGESLQSKCGGENSTIAQGFVTASLVFCIGTMAVVGSMESGINHNHTTLFVKSLIDGTAAIIFSSTLGIGVIFSAVSVFIYQGILTVFASFLKPYLTDNMLLEMSITGGILIAAIGINMFEIKKIKVGNMLPAIFIPVIFYTPFFQNIINFFKGLFF